MRNTQHVPTCPQCGAAVYRTHTCRKSGLTQFALPENAKPQPTAPPLQLVPMPEGWRSASRELMDRTRTGRSSQELEAMWPTRAQLHLVEDVELDWSDGEDAS